MQGAGMQERLNLDSIRAARLRIAGRVLRTPLVPSPSLSALTGQPVWLKLEHQQITGAFKLRGATNAILSLGEAERARGVVTVSTGNHGRAVAQAARAAGVPATVCLSTLVPANKVAAVRAAGAEVRVGGRSQDEAQETAERLVREEGKVFIPPFDHPAVIAGQGTLGLEILEDLPEAETLVVPLSGGGLIAGIALAAKALQPDLRVVGVSMRQGAAMAASLAAGQPVAVAEVETLADSLGGGIGLDNRYTFALVRDLVDEVLLLEEAEIAAGIRHAYAEEREILEGAAAVGLGALLAGKLTLTGPTVLLLSGKNIDMERHRRIVCAEGGSA